MKRTILAFVGGLATIMIVIAIFDAINYSLFPPPDHLDPTNKEDLAEIIRLAPTAAWILLLIGHVVGSIAGGFVIGRVASDNARRAAIICGVVMMVLATLNNVFVGSTPAWYWVVDLAIYIPFCLLGYKLSLRSKTHMSTDQ